MLDEQTIQNNKSQFITLFSNVSRPGILELLSFLDKSDFYEAPATAIGYGNYKGGLCEYALHTYDNLVQLCKIKTKTYPQDTLKIIGLLSNLSKVDYYEEQVQNRKTYSSTGSRKDAGGTYDWEVVKGYRVKEYGRRPLNYGNLQVNAYIVLNNFIPLTAEETLTILNINCSTENNRELFTALEECPLLVLAHCASILAAHL